MLRSNPELRNSFMKQASTPVANATTAEMNAKYAQPRKKRAEGRMRYASGRSRASRFCLAPRNSPESRAIAASLWTEFLPDRPERDDGRGRRDSSTGHTRRGASGIDEVALPVIA